MSETVRSVRQAFAILRLLAQDGPLSLSAIGRALNLSPSSCFNLLRTLLDEAAIEREPETKRYLLTSDWSAANLFRDDRARAMLSRLRPAMSRFAQEYGTTVGLWAVIPDRRLLLIGHADCDAAMRIQLADGQRQPLGGGAVGKALAAAQAIDEAELVSRHKEVRWQVHLNLSHYREEVTLAARRGFALDEGNAFAGVYSVAAAVGGTDPEFLMSSSVFAGSRTAAEIAGIGEALAALAQRSA